MLLDRFKRAHARQEAMRQAYQDTFGSDAGRLVLHDILSRGGLLETSQVGGDSHTTAFREGRRAIALEIINNLRWTPAEVMTLALQRTAATLAQAQEDHDE